MAVVAIIAAVVATATVRDSAEVTLIASIQQVLPMVSAILIVQLHLKD